ncbi:MAG: phospholipase D-like domain-containing protein [Candidatus Methanomethylophilaceae archaeon]|nr:phospholipase D-like domain-containing protein [Candidatus Methanomethylophilaceae archaeon]
MQLGRDALAIAVVLLMVFAAIPVIAETDHAEVPAGNKIDGVRLYEVVYNDPDLGDCFSIKNYGSKSVSLNGYYVKTQGGKQYDLPNMTLTSGEIVAFIKSKVSDSWFCKDRTVKITSGIGTMFTNTGTNVYLCDSFDKNVDVVSYGSVKTMPSTKDWIGDSVPLSNMKEAIRRVEPRDSNSNFDWTATSDGMTSNGFYDVPEFTGNVLPFVFPDSKGEPILRALKDADTSIHISIYMLTSKHAASILAAKAEEGVDVKVLLENKPLGYDHTYDILQSIVDKGGNVSFIGFPVGGSTSEDRYSYVHNKYCIIDGETVIVTSENWTGPNLGDGKGNRGWGAVVESTGYAAYMESYFSNDWNGKDVATLDEKLSSPVSGTPLFSMEEISTYVDALPESGSVINGAHLKMYMSPDNTFKAINYYMSNAQERIYTEQMDVGKSFENPDNQSPIRFMLDAAARGVDAKFMISEDSEELLSYLRSHGVKTAKMSQNGYSTMHNKGVIIDDCVWISSVNWTENAFLNNRECGLYIMDERVTEFYLAEYMEDWDYNYVPSDDQPLDVPVETVATVSIGAVIIGFLVYLYNNFLGGGKKKKRR